jgi:hypothetical protein
LHTLLGALKLVYIFFGKFAVHRGWITPRSTVRGDAIIFPSARRDQQSYRGKSANYIERDWR